MENLRKNLLNCQWIFIESIKITQREYLFNSGSSRGMTHVTGQPQRKHHHPSCYINIYSPFLVCCWHPTSQSPLQHSTFLGSQLLLGRNPLPVVQNIVKVLVLGKLHLLTQGVACCYIGCFLSGAFLVRPESLPDPQCALR